MAQINVSNTANKVAEKTDELVKSAELNESKQAEAQPEPAELTNNTSENTEDTKETAPKARTKEAKAGNKVVATYIGSGIWQDENGDLWARNTSSLESDNILSERQYDLDKFEKREDLKFMVSYGSMKTTVVEE